MYIMYTNVGTIHIWCLFRLYHITYTQLELTVKCQPFEHPYNVFITPCNIYIARII